MLYLTHLALKRGVIDINFKTGATKMAEDVGYIFLTPRPKIQVEVVKIEVKCTYFIKISWRIQKHFDAKFGH